MPINEDADTDHTKAIKIEHMSHRWVRMLDRLIGQAVAANGGYFDIFAAFRGKDKPIETDINMKYQMKHQHKLD